MPELPEVETTRRGIAPHVEGRQVTAVVVRNAQLRWPVPASIRRELPGQQIARVERRAKYLLLRSGIGTVIVHLGMSGSLRVVPATEQPRKHDHVDIVLDTGQCLRLHDPRRFGTVQWTRQPPDRHRLLRDLGPEPLSDQMNGGYLRQAAHGRRVAVKQFIMDAQVLVGVGNIYANEALFVAGIRPTRAAGRIALARYERLADAIREVIRTAIASGGTTLRDFLQSDGQPGYFKQQLRVYDRAGQPCVNCGRPVKRIVQGQRASFFCPHCQR